MQQARKMLSMGCALQPDACPLTVCCWQVALTVFGVVCGCQPHVLTLTRAAGRSSPVLPGYMTFACVTWWGQEPVLLPSAPGLAC